MAYHGSIKTSPYELVYGHNAVLPWEVRTGSRRVTLQNDLSAEVYKNLMIDSLEDLSCLRMCALENIKANKLRVVKFYNKKVKIKQFSEGDLVWKVKLPIGSNDAHLVTLIFLETLREEEEFGRAVKWRIFEGILP